MGVHWGCRDLGDIIGVGETATLKLAQMSSEFTEVWVRLDGWEMRFTTIVRVSFLLFILKRPSTSSLPAFPSSITTGCSQNYRDVTMEL